MKVLNVLLLCLAVALQYRFWLGDGSVHEITQLREQIDNTRVQWQTYNERNEALEAEIRDLKTGLDALEELARSELGMIQQGEVFFQIVSPDPE